MSARDVILVTGAAGFIGSHIARVARDAGSKVVGIDRRAAEGVEQGGIGNIELVKRVLKEHQVTAVIHCAGRICVAESFREAGRYFDDNVTQTLRLLDAISDVGGLPFVLSSSAAVYGNPPELPVREAARYAPVSPYGATKLAAEHALAGYGRSIDFPWVALRYFNAAGAHPDGSIAELHRPETHLIPLAIDAARETGPELEIYGRDYPTRDGTAVRDYVHVYDLAQAHLTAIDKIEQQGTLGALNLGAGRGTSVLEVLYAVATATGREVPHSYKPRREGDPPELVADVTKARRLLDWAPSYSSIEKIVEDAARARKVNTP